MTNNLFVLALALIVSVFVSPFAHAQDDENIEPVRLFERADISKVPSVPPEAMKQGTFTYGGITKPYALFTPPKTGRTPKQLLVFLHGCTESAEEFAGLTRMNELAIRENFFILYPEQTTDANPMRCWNWFESINPGTEREWIAALTSAITEQISADRERIVVAGISAGGAMAANLLSCHPDLYAGGAVYAGIPFAAAQSLLEATRAMTLGSPKSARDSAQQAFECSGQKLGRPVSLLVVHGTRDELVDIKNARQTLEQIAALNDLRDDGLPNDSFSLRLDSRKQIAKRGEHRAVIELYGSAYGARLELVRIQRLGHAWSGGADGFRYSSKKGPSGSELLWQFMGSIAPQSATAE